MKKIVILSSILGLLLGSTSCREEFLHTEPTETISNPPAQGKLYGLYSMMIKIGVGGTTAHEDFGQKGIDIYLDLLSGDLALSRDTYGRYTRVANMSGMVDLTRNENYIPWRYYYRIVYAANDVIVGLGGNDAVPKKEEDKYAMGQAKAMRAYSYFYLSQLYNTKYDPVADSIPLYTGGGVSANPKAKQSEVYAQIVSDLKSAITLLEGYTRPNKGAINKEVAKGLLAYTYAAMGENELAANLSKEIMGVYAKSAASDLVYNATTQSGGGFNDVRTSSWMWGYDITLENDLDLVSWWGQMDIYTYSYAIFGDYKVIDSGLLSSIKADDIRKGQFHRLGFPSNKFFHSERVQRGQRNITSDYLFMRSDEFYMLAAETLAKSGQIAEAKKILKDFLAIRLPDTSYIDTLSNADLLKEIYLQTRIEFFAEGKSYLAMKRNKATITRGTNHLYFAGKQYSYDSDELTFEIPQAELNENPHF